MGKSNESFLDNNSSISKFKKQVLFLLYVIACLSVGCSDGFKVQRPQGGTSGASGSSSGSSTGSGGGTLPTNTTQPKGGSFPTTTTMANRPTTSTTIVTPSTSQPQNTTTTNRTTVPTTTQPSTSTTSTIPPTTLPQASTRAGPAIFFVDVESGPTSGGPNGLGAPIAIFGKGFGATRGTSKVTIGGVEVANYMVWGQNNAINPNLDKIEVQPGPNNPTGPIVVTVNGVASNADVTFTVRNGNVFYIAPNGSDSNACSSGAPCLNLLTLASKMQPGDITLVRDGTYNESEVWIHNMSGALGKPKVFKAYPGEKPFYPNGSRPIIISSDYVTISGLTLQNGKGIGNGGDTEGQTGNRILNNSFTGDIGYEATGAHGNDHVIAGNYCILNSSNVGTQGHCFYISFGNNVKVIHNVGGGTAGYGIHIFDQQRQTGDFKRIISNLLVEGNLCINSTERSGLIMAMGDEGGLGNRIENVTVRNNIFTGNDLLGASVGVNVHNVKIYNNTFYQNGLVSLEVGGTSTETDGIDIRNNLFYQSPNTSCKVNCSWYPNLHIAIEGTPGVTVSGNYYGPGAPEVRVGSGSNWNPVSLENRAVIGTVNFADPANYNFSLLPGSVSIDTCSALPEVLRDILGVPRPQGGACDMGAYEFVQ